VTVLRPLGTLVVAEVAVDPVLVGRRRSRERHRTAGNQRYGLSRRTQVRIEDLVLEHDALVLVLIEHPGNDVRKLVDRAGVHGARHDAHRSLTAAVLDEELRDPGEEPWRDLLPGAQHLDEHHRAHVLRKPAQQVLERVEAGLPAAEDAGVQGQVPATAAPRA
jgi:hypothetical protein